MRRTAGAAGDEGLVGAQSGVAQATAARGAKARRGSCSGTRYLPTALAVLEFQPAAESAACSRNPADAEVLLGTSRNASISMQ